MGIASGVLVVLVAYCAALRKFHNFSAIVVTGNLETMTITSRVLATLVAYPTMRP